MLFGVLEFGVLLGGSFGFWIQKGDRGLVRRGWEGGLFYLYPECINEFCFLCNTTLNFRCDT